QRKAAAEARKQQTAAEEAARAAKIEFLSSLTQPQPMGFRDASIAMGGTAPAGYSAPQQATGRIQMTPQLYGRAKMAGLSDAEIKALVESPDWGRQEVARLVDMADPQGRPAQQQYDRFGQPIGGAIPKAYERKTVDLGGAVQERDPYTGQMLGSLPKTQTPDSLASNALTMRGQNISAGTAAARLAFDREQAAGGGADGGFQYMQTPTGIVAVPKRPGADGMIQSRPVVDATGAPVGGTGQTTTQQKVAEANDALALIKQAEALIGKATGSLVGRGVDIAGQAVGVSTGGAQAAAQLQALEGALVAKMPKMSGPQSDKDVLLYRQMAGQIGDPTLPADTKRAALKTITEIQKRYAGIPDQPQGQQAPARMPGGQAFSSMPPAAEYRGRVVRDQITGKTFKSNGMSWVEQ
ncbi:MAG: hypothetical protein ACOYKQ_07975, partial [Polymorphobacter sp.]